MTAKWFDWKQGNLTLRLHVKAKATHTRVEQLHGGRLVVRLQAPPVDGKANLVLVKMLSAEFGVSASRVRIVSGLSHRDKSVRIETPRVLPSWYEELGGLPG